MAWANLWAASFLSCFHELNHFACGLTTWDQRVRTIQGRDMEMFKLLQGCKAKPCGRPDPDSVVPSAPHHDRDSSTFRNERGCAAFFLCVDFSVLRRYSHCLWSPLSQRNDKNTVLCEGMRNYFSFFLSKTLIVSFPDFSFASTALYNKKMGFPYLFSYLIKSIWDHYFFFNAFKARTARSSESTGWTSWPRAAAITAVPMGAAWGVPEPHLRRMRVRQGWAASLAHVVTLNGPGTHGLGTWMAASM